MRTTSVPWFVLRRWRRYLAYSREAPGREWMVELVLEDMEKFR